MERVQRHLVVADLKFLPFPLLQLAAAFQLLVQRERGGVLQWQIISSHNILTSVE